MTPLLIDLPSVYAGTLQEFTIPCASILASGETIASVTAGVQVWTYTTVPDSNASQLLRGSASISGSSVQAWVGGIPTSTNFLPGAVYSLAFQLTTSLGNTPIVIGNISVSPITPPSLGTGATLPSTEFNKTSSFTPGLGGTYHCNGTGIVVAIPSTGVGGDMLIINESTSQNVTFSGSVANYTVLPTLTPGSSLVLRWSTLKSAYVMVS